MTSPDEQPTALIPVIPAEPVRDRRKLALIGVPVLILLVLCCGGTALVRNWFHGGSSNSAASAGSPVLVDPRTVTMPPVPSGSALSPTPDPTLSSGVPSASATTKPSASTKPTTKKPATTKPTTKTPTTKPTTASPTPTATKTTTPPIQQGVVRGASCSPEGAYGFSTRGRLLRCEPSGHGGDVWQSA